MTGAASIAWREPPLAGPGAWAGLWRRIGVKAALSARPA